MPLPPLLQLPRTERKNETNWSPLGFPGARAGVLELGRGGGRGAGATPGTQLWQLWSGLEQWPPHGAPGWPSPAPRRAQPGSPARSPAWAGAGRSRRAQAPGPQVLGRRHADAGCPPHRRRSTAREEGQSKADPARARQAQWLTSGQAGSDIISAQRRRRACVPILQMRRLRLREITLQGSQREEEHGFKPGSLTVALQASLPPGPRVGTCGFLLPPSVTHCSAVSALPSHPAPPLPSDHLSTPDAQAPPDTGGHVLRLFSPPCCERAPPGGGTQPCLPSSLQGLARCQAWDGSCSASQVTSPSSSGVSRPRGL